MNVHRPRIIAALALLVPYLIAVLLFESINFIARIFLIIFTIGIVALLSPHIKNYFSKRRNRS